MLKSRKFNKHLARYRFWYELEEYFRGFQDLLKPNKYLNYEDRQALYKIHSLLFESYKLTKNKLEMIKV